MRSHASRSASAPARWLRWIPAAVVTSAVVVVTVVGNVGGRERAAHGAGAQPTALTVGRALSLAAANGFENRAQQMLGRRFSATYRVTLFRYHGRVFRGRVSYFSLPGHRGVFRETPAFSTGPATHDQGYEVLAGRHGYVNCDLRRAGSRWACYSEVGEGMGGMWVQNGQIAPQAFVGGLDAGINAFTQTSGAPYPLFLSHGHVDGRAVSCISIGDRRGALGRICIMHNGLVVSYRLAHYLSDYVYAQAQLVSYSTRVPRGILRPPARVQTFGS